SWPWWWASSARRFALPWCSPSRSVRADCAFHVSTANETVSARPKGSGTRSRRGDVGPVLPLLPAVGSVRRSDPPGDDGVPCLTGLPAPGTGGVGPASARSAWQVPASSAAAVGERARPGAGSTVGSLRVVRRHLLGYAGDHQL